MNDELQYEVEALCRAEGRTRAEAYRHAPDPFGDIKPSLLSADDIHRYVMKTGLIAPYFRGGEKARLKKASYEGRIGSKAYKYDIADCLIQKSLSDGFLTVPANSIVFVESDLDFYLPSYIALRYNLQIRHVHRGLLLGTGPLVDPGYWGKLCIPLHNLTSEEYAIPIEEGLIWIEFTKTTSDPETGRNPFTDNADHPGHWDIKKFIRKAAEPMNDGATVAIRSSIPKAVSAATTVADEARQRSETAEQKAGTTETLFNRIAIGAAFFGFGAIVALWASFWFGVKNDISALSARIDSIVTPPQAELARHGDRPETALPSVEVLEDELRTLRIENQRLRGSLESEPNSAAGDGSGAK